MREDSRPPALRITLQVERDIDPPRPGQVRDSPVVEIGDIVKFIDRIQQPGAHFVLRFGPIGESVDLKPVLVVKLEQSRHQIHGRMIVKVGRKIAEADLRTRCRVFERVGPDTPEFFLGPCFRI
ncbi:MAG TPA: hypothetical protein VNT42_12210 [Sphingomonas sp.]|nr:hypothetical protein [Sphingomonas sp.]